jgi:hypothetical protein
MAGKTFLLRAPPAFGNPAVLMDARHPNSDFADYNNALRTLRDELERTVFHEPALRGTAGGGSAGFDFVESGVVRYLDAFSFGFDAPRSLRTR